MWIIHWSVISPFLESPGWVHLSETLLDQLLWSSSLGIGTPKASILLWFHSTLVRTFTFLSGPVLGLEILPHIFYDNFSLFISCFVLVLPMRLGSPKVQDATDTSSAFFLAESSMVRHNRLVIVASQLNCISKFHCTSPIYDYLPKTKGEVALCFLNDYLFHISDSFCIIETY